MEYQRTGHALKLNHSGALPRYLIAYATATEPTATDTARRKLSHRFLCGAAISARLQGVRPVAVKDHAIESPSDLWRLVAEVSGPRHTTWVISHNILRDLILSGFTERFERVELVIEWPRTKRKEAQLCEPNTLRRTSCMIEIPPTIIAVKWVATQGRVVFVDTLNWFPVSLSDLAAAIGSPLPSKPNEGASLPSWRAYCKCDCQTVFTAFVELVQWIKRNDLGMFRYTGPSQAMSAFRHRFMRHKILVHDSQPVKVLERDSYFGGRTEVFKSGPIDQPVYQVDVNALFPSVMRACLYPVCLDRFELREEYLPMRPAIDWSRSIADVEVSTPVPLYPLRLESMVIYPVGRFRTTLASHELQHAIKRGHVQAVGRWAEYRVEPIFVEWVDQLWAMRRLYARQGKQLYSEFTKLLMNALYGKFAQKSPAWVDVHNDKSGLPWESWLERDPRTAERISYRMFGWQLQRFTKREEIAGTFVAISAFVTAAARMRMNELRHKAGYRQVLYQGVDALIVTQQGYDSLINAGEVVPDQLGKLRLQLATDQGEIIGTSDYRLGEKIVISGRAREASIAANGEVMQHKYAATSQLFCGGPSNVITEEITTWQRQAKQLKRSVGVDGWTEPLVFGLQQQPLALEPSNEASS